DRDSYSLHRFSGFVDHATINHRTAQQTKQHSRDLLAGYKCQDRTITGSLGLIPRVDVASVRSNKLIACRINLLDLKAPIVVGGSRKNVRGPSGTLLDQRNERRFACRAVPCSDYASGDGAERGLLLVRRARLRT